MRKSFFGLALIAFGLTVSNQCFAPASNTGAQNLTYSIPAVSVFSLSGDVAFGTFGTPVAGSNFDVVSRNSTLTYNVTNNAGSSSRKITVQLAAAPATGMRLVMNTAGPPGAQTIGNFALTDTSTLTTVTGIGNGAFPNIGVGIAIVADVGTAAVGSGSFTVVFTLAPS